MVAKRPKLIVFDLDYTLWPFWVDTHVTRPFHKDSNGKVYDSSGAVISYYSEVPAILKNLQNSNYQLAVASRTSEIKGAKELLDLFDWSSYFTYTEIFPGRKTTHFNNLKTKSKLSFSDMLFFDDELRNINDLRAIGVTSILVKNGVNTNVITEGLQQYVRDHKS